MEVCANIQAIKYLFKYLTKGGARIQALLAGPPPTIGLTLAHRHQWTRLVNSKKGALCRLFRQNGALTSTPCPRGFPTSCAWKCTSRISNAFTSGNEITAHYNSIKNL